MYGAILGDIIGSPYEFDANNIKTTDFSLFSERSEFTDDSIMTCAVAEGHGCGRRYDGKIDHRSYEEIRKPLSVCRIRSQFQYVAPAEGP